ncbi:hypothetical protein [Candidatus Wolbachia massiliensis]|uniref:Uncharacterized protein n=1 Tax=Candidatus Wolbachia massiliensis TaxID=1845000 RepID=A0A7L7YLA6_9RICK|nr:hypothetical protein [Candidatus Wolbachia massiliensis]QOD38040.1 hypothetical protein ID128_04370 [Candidatus Wolbachia massiliensis]
MFCESSEKDAEISSPKSQPAKQEAQPDQKEAEILSPKNQPAKEENGQGWGAWVKSLFTSTKTSHLNSESKGL